MNYYVSCLIALLNLSIIVSVKGQNLDEVLYKHFTAIGQNSRNQLRSMFLEIMEINELRQEKKYSVILKKPNKIRIEGIWEEQNYIKAYDGMRAWTKAPWTGVSIAQLMTLNESDDIKSFDGINSPIYDCQQNKDEIQYQGLVTIKGDSNHKLRVRSIENPTIEYFLNADTYLLSRSIRYSRKNDSLVVEEVNYDKYTKYSIPGQGNINLPMSLEVQRLNSKIELIIMEVILGFGAPNSYFTKPE